MMEKKHKSTNFSYESLSTFTKIASKENREREREPKLEFRWICIDHYYKNTMGQHEVEYNLKSVKTSSQPASLECRYIQIYSSISNLQSHISFWYIDTHTHTWMGIYGKIIKKSHYFLLKRLERILLNDLWFWILFITRFSQSAEQKKDCG